MPTARLHTIFLHGGRGKTEKGNAAASIKHYRRILENRIKCIEAETAKGVYEWQVPPGNVAKDDSHPKWSGAFRANWQVKVGGKFDSGWQSSVAPERYPWTQDPDDGSRFRNWYSNWVNPDLANIVLDGEEWRNASVKDAIHIGNVSPYAKWLNDGGYEDEFGLDGTYRVFTPGYFFMELCMEYMRMNRGYYIKKGLEIANTKPSQGGA